MNDLIPHAEMIAARLKARRESIAIAESSPGGLISAVLLALPGASAYSLGGAVAYTRPSKIMLLGLDKAALAQFRPATEGHVLLLVRGAQGRFAANWGLGETGATGLTSNRYGDPVGHTCLAVAGPVERSRPAAPSGSTTCTPLPPPALSFWPKQSPSIGHAKRFLPPVSQPAVLL